MNRNRTAPVVRDRGFTLAETLVVTVLFALVGAIVTVASVTGLRHQTQLQDRSDAIAQARTALERVDRDIRSAYPLLSASATQLVLQEVQPTVTRFVTYSVSGGSLVASLTDTPTGGGAATTSSRVLIRNLVNPASSPVFSYAPVPGYSAPANSGINASTCAMANGSFDPGCIGTVTVHVSVKPSTLAAPVDVSDRGTDLRNAT